MAEPQIPLTDAVGLAYQGQSIDITSLEKGEFKNPSQVSIVSQYDAYSPDPNLDYSDLANLNSEIIKVRIRLHGIRQELKQAKRKLLTAKFNYESEKKRRMISISGSSEKMREALAELMTEQLYTDYLVANAVADEINQHSRDLRMDLDALKELSNNIRRLMSEA